MFFASSAPLNNLMLAQNLNLLKMQIIILNKKIGPAQNILGPVKGQVID